MSSPVDFDLLLPQANLALQKALGYGVVLSDPVVIKDGVRSLIVRCEVKSASSEIMSVILKHIKDQPTRGFSEWASLVFLSSLPELQGSVPRFYAGDVSHRFFLMEDWGEGESLEELLMGTDPAAVHTALQTIAVQMARLHAATLGKHDAFEAIRASLPHGEGIDRVQEANGWLENRGKILDWFEAAGCVLPPDFEKSLKYLSDGCSQPGEFLAFTHGDPAPSNNHFARGQARLLDFEYGGFRHALYDITAWNILCPLPTKWVGKMVRAFQEELAKTCPAARDETRFAEAWACFCAYRALAILTWISPDVIYQNRPWVGEWTMREAVFVAVARMEQATAPFIHLEPISEVGRRLSDALRLHWDAFKGIEVESVLPPWAVLKAAE